MKDFQRGLTEGKETYPECKLHCPSVWDFAEEKVKEEKAS